MTNELLGILLPAICIVLQTNQYRSCNGTFESRSFRQACAVRNEDSRYEIEKGKAPGNEVGDQVNQENKNKQLKLQNNIDVLGRLPSNG